MSSTRNKALRFQEYACLIDVSFWQLVIQKKLNTWKLDCPPLLLLGSLECAPTPSSRPVIRLDATSPATTRSETARSIVGCFYHVNTLEEFQSFPFSDKIAESTARAIRFLEQDGRHDDASLNSEYLFKNVLNPFFIVAYMNLKQYNVVYCVSCPTFGFKRIPVLEASFSRSSSPINVASEETPLKKESDSPSLHGSSGVFSPSEPEGCVAPLTSVRYLTFRAALPAHKEFSENEIIHIGRHLKDLCCCHNSEQKRRSTSSICLLLKSSSVRGLHHHQSSYYSMADIFSCTSLQKMVLNNIDDVYLCIHDYSKTAKAVSWSTRNLLFTVCSILQLYSVNLKVFAFRESARASCSRVFYIRTPPEQAFLSGPVVLAGWLINRRWRSNCMALEERSASVPAHALFELNLQSFLDTTTVQQEATELNVKLIKWRILPAFDPSRLRDLRFLIIGMGTLGCHIARDLVGWGVTRFTLVDCGTISPSNPARQSLYLARDVGTMKKVFVARDRLLEIRGDLEVATFDFEVPMPNQHRFLLPYDQYVGKGEEENGKLCYGVWVERRLRQLIGSHDVTLLLTDTRESRWLPSLISQSFSYSEFKQDRCDVRHRLESPFRPPMCITVALGFDTFVVIRHGSYCDALVSNPNRGDGAGDAAPVFRPADVLKSRLSCYFCNDLSAPSALNSRYRTLDQQCTVTRTGVAGLASAVTVELISTMSQADYGFGMLPIARLDEIRRLLAKKHTDETDRMQSILSDRGHVSCLGDAPHVTRGSVSSLQVASDWHANFERCVCCSAAVQEAYFLKGSTFVEEVIANAQVLEETSGLRELRNHDDINLLVYPDDEEEDYTSAGHVVKEQAKRLTLPL